MAIVGLNSQLIQGWRNLAPTTSGLYSYPLAALPKTYAYPPVFMTNPYVTQRHYSQPVLSNTHLRSVNPNSQPQRPVVLNPLPFHPVALATAKKPLSTQTKFFMATSYLSILTGVVGGIVLIAGSIPLFRPALKQILKKVGLGTLTACIAASSLSELGVGINQKQPSLILCNAVFLPATFLFMRETPLIRGLYLFLMGAYYAGYGNIVENKFQKQRGHAKRQMPSPLADLSKTAAFMVDDHRLILGTLKRSGAIVTQLWTDLRRAAQAVIDGRPLYINPSADRMRLSAFCHYVGGAMLMLSGKNPKLAGLGSLVATLGGIGSNLEFFAIGTQRSDLIGTALKVGIPIQVLGKALFHTNIGYAIEFIGQGLSYFLNLPLLGHDK